MITIRLGRSASRMMVSEVWYGTESRPATSGIIGRLPAATTNRSAVIVSAPTARCFAPTK